MSLVNIALVIKLFENFLYYLFVVFIGRADKLIVIGVEAVPHFFYLRGNLIHILLRAYALSLGVFFNLLTVLVRAGL